MWAKIKLPAFSGDANAERPKTDFMTTEKLPNILKSNTENHQDVTVSIYNLSLRGDTHLHKKENVFLKEFSFHVTCQSGLESHNAFQKDWLVSQIK